MTTVFTPKLPGIPGARVNGKLRWAVLACMLSAASAAAQDGPVHRRDANAVPPGAIGGQRLMGVGPLSCFIQPVEVEAPEGAKIAFAAGESFDAGAVAPRLVGMQVLQIYRLRVTQIPNHPGVEVFPTIQLLDRLHPPSGEATRFPVPIELTEEELLLAARGAFVTRVIYVEDPDQAAPVSQENDQQRWFEAAAGEDPLRVAYELGRPIAILRIGGRLPDQSSGIDEGFLLGTAPVVELDASITDYQVTPSY